MTLAELKYLWYADLYRHTGSTRGTVLARNLLENPCFKYSFVLRLCQYALAMQAVPIRRKLLLAILRRLLRHYSHKFSIYIPPQTTIAAGLYITHPGTVVVNARSVIGKNFTLSQGVTLGRANRGPNQGAPVVGDNVYIGPGAKIVGAVRIGNNVAIGANCVVTKDVPDHAVVVGVPGRVISYNGAAEYIDHAI